MSVSSQKLKEIMKKIPCLGNTSKSNPRGKFHIFLFDSRTAPLFRCIIYIICSERKSSVVAVGVKLDSSVSDTHTVKSMHYYCKVNYNYRVVLENGLAQVLELTLFFLQVLASEASELLDVYKDLQSLESASKVCICAFSGVVDLLLWLII